MNDENKQKPTAFDPAAHGWKNRPSEGFSELVGPIWTKKDGPVWRYGFQAEDKHENRQGAVHGGMLMTFADHAIGMTAWEAAGRRKCVTMQLEINFSRPGALAISLNASAKSFVLPVALFLCGAF